MTPNLKIRPDNVVQLNNPTVDADSSTVDADSATIYADDYGQRGVAPKLTVKD